MKHARSLKLEGCKQEVDETARVWTGLELLLAIAKVGVISLTFALFMHLRENPGFLEHTSERERKEMIQHDTFELVSFAQEKKK